jgi:hypothetical protein
VEKYRVAIYKNKTRTRRDSNGRTHMETERVFSHYETRYRTHPEYWKCHDNIGEDYGISRQMFQEIVEKFGGAQSEKTDKSGFYSGDPNIYVANNKTGYVYPVVSLRSFENRIKAAPSVFSFAKVPKDIPVFPYPQNAVAWRSDRLVGTASKTFNLLEWDRLNARLGPSKKVNLILVGFETEDSSMGQWQEAAWLGGKKNDLVVCYGGRDPKRPSWVYVFGWTEKNIVKQNLTTMFLNQELGNQLLPKIEEEVRRNYVIKDWHKFDYITVEPPLWAYGCIFVVVAITQFGVWFWATKNDQDRGGRRLLYPRRFGI